MTLNATRVECGALGTDPCAYRVVAEQLPDVAVFVFDRDLRFELATGAAVREMGWRPEEIIGRTLFELGPPDRVERYAVAYRAALAGERQSFEVQGWRNPGTVWAVDVVPVRGAGGAITGGMVFSTDITERRRTERELRERRRQLAEAQRIARVGNWEWDLGSGTGSASAEWFRVVGVRPEDIPSPEAALGFVHPDDRPVVEAAIDRAAGDGTPFEVEHRTILLDGQVRAVLARGEAVRDEHGRIVRIIGTNQDVTEARQAEQERQRLLGRLYEVLEGQHQRLAVDLHDGHVQSLAAMGLKLDQVRLRLGAQAPAPVRAATHDRRAPPAGAGPVRPGDRRPRPGARHPQQGGAGGLLGQRPARRPAARPRCGDGPVPGRPAGARQRRAARGRAARSGHAGAVGVDGDPARPGRRARVRPDRGRGARRPPGLRADLHAGAGPGARRPARDRDRARRHLHPGVGACDGGPGTRAAAVTRPRVMVADDHRQFREALVALLELDGFEVVGQAADGADAVALAKQVRPDVVVMDLSMPVLNGLDATRLVRDALPSTPVVVLTAFTGEELERAALAAGATAYVAKDANLEELRATLAAAVAALADRPDPGR
jgi:PAS domain S-box-containing protein